ncbi:YeeE/YedE family protein [Deinococcus peraridilitoris]|uniref:Putative transporter component n=1 Tax=Deinococcus peraridilitoris (strain DSM 19664 / LMG 22246 / CIP 109416 / KR-200) TaxID=937777 RepID=L0A0U4_DEIPD|nr:YeeE/YedE thiosulfate transporter family protein [Deinococcus peraridilitoris]AFZ66605.1 putative transporter component [Deinococcus peraridilitoris DSM 19664]
MEQIQILELLRNPWPWYVAGPLIGLTVPLLFLIGNKGLGISANLRHACAILLPDQAKPGFFRYNWHAEKWNLVFAFGLLLGGFLAGVVFADPEPTELSNAALRTFQSLGVDVQPGLVPPMLERVTDLRTFTLLAISGLLVGFGTRYGGGCTSGHAITGLSTLQFPSLVATVSFFIGGIISANLLLPLFLK